MRILVTGASGMLGRALVHAATDRGHQVRAMIRPTSRRDRVPLPDEQIFVADMTDAERFPRLVEGIEGIIHCAAVTSEGRPDEALSRRVNVDGTAALLRAARAAGTVRWVQISSMSAHPGSTSVYGRTKLAADEVLRAAPPGTLPVWTILRPSLIYGPDPKGLVGKTLNLLERLPVLPMLGSGWELLRPVYVTDVAEAALTCLGFPGTAGRTYMIGGADEVTLNEFMSRLAKTFGLRRPLVHLPLPLCAAMAWGMSLVIKRPPITVDNVKGVREVPSVDQEDAVRDWGYEPMNLEQGLRRTREGYPGRGGRPA